MPNYFYGMLKHF